LLQYGNDAATYSAVFNYSLQDSLLLCWLGGAFQLVGHTAVKEKWERGYKGKTKEKRRVKGSVFLWQGGCCISSVLGAHCNTVSYWLFSRIVLVVCDFLLVAMEGHEAHRVSIQAIISIVCVYKQYACLHPLGSIVASVASV